MTIKIETDHSMSFMDSLIEDISNWGLTNNEIEQIAGIGERFPNIYVVKMIDQSEICTDAGKVTRLRASHFDGKKVLIAYVCGEDSGRTIIAKLNTGSINIYTKTLSGRWVYHQLGQTHIAYTRSTVEEAIKMCL